MHERVSAAEMAQLGRDRVLGDCAVFVFCTVSVSGRVQIQTSARWELCIIWTLPKTVFVERLTRLAHFKGIQKYGLRDLEFLPFSEIHY